LRKGKFIYLCIPLTKGKKKFIERLKIYLKQIVEQNIQEDVFLRRNGFESSQDKRDKQTFIFYNEEFDPGSG